MLNLPENAPAVQKPKHPLLPLLTVLFLVSYALMALLVVEQGQTIDSQRGLIRQLFSDSTELNAMKAKASRQPKTDAPTQAQPQAPPQAQPPSSQVPERDGARNDRDAGKEQRQVPQRPPRQTSDNADERRILISI